MTCGRGKQNVFTHITSCDVFKKTVSELYGLRADGGGVELSPTFSAAFSSVMVLSEYSVNGVYSTTVFFNEKQA